MEKAITTAIAPADGRGAVTRIGAWRRSPSPARQVTRAREARRELRPRSERFTHLKRMYD